MNIGKNRFDIQLSKIETLLEKSLHHENASVYLFLNDLRTPIFMLEALSRIYGDIASNEEDFEKLLRKFKTLEDALGAIDHYGAMQKEFADHEKVNSRIKHYFELKTREKIEDFDYLLCEKNWLNGKQIKKIKAQLKEIDWPDDKKDLKQVESYIKEEIEDIHKFVTDLAFTFDNLEEDVHELRRRIRWISIYAQALGGVFVYTSEKSKANSTLKKYLTPEIVNSPYNVLPQSLAIKQPIPLNQNYFYAMSWLIAALGKIKDEGLKILTLKEAIQYLNLIKDEDAFNQTYQILGKKQQKIDALLLHAQEITKTYFTEDNLRKVFSK